MCNWSSYAENDLVEINSFQDTPSIKIIRLMCSGRIQPTLILDAFSHGSDGVLVCGCPIGACHYISGNKNAEDIIKKTKEILDHLNIKKERLKLELIESIKVHEFTKVIKNFTDQVISLGPFDIIIVENM